MAIMQVDFLAVGQGNCEMVQVVDDKSNVLYLALVDCGSNGGEMEKATFEKQYDIIRDAMKNRAHTATIAGQLDEPLTHLLDCLIVTHADVDHINCLTKDKLFKNLKRSSMADKDKGNMHEKSNTIDVDGGRLQCIHKVSEEQDSFKYAEAIYVYEECSNKDGPIDYYKYIVDSQKTDETVYGERHTECKCSKSKRVECDDELFLDMNSWIRIDQECAGDMPSGIEAGINCILKFYYDEITGYIEINIKSKVTQTQTAPDLYYPSCTGNAVFFCDGETHAPFHMFFDTLEKLEDINMVIGTAHNLFIFMYGEMCNYEKWDNEFIEQFKEQINIMLEEIKNHYIDTFSFWEGNQQKLKEYDVNYIIETAEAGDEAEDEVETLLINAMYWGGCGAEKLRITAKGIYSELYDYSTSVQSNLSDASALTPGGDLTIGMCCAPGIVYCDKAGNLEISMGLEKKITTGENDRSIMTAFYHKDDTYQVFLPGDATRISMKYYVKYGHSKFQGWITCDGSILAAPHHGSWKTCGPSGKNESNSVFAQLCESINPFYIVISAGYPNKFGHPHISFTKLAEKILTDDSDVHQISTNNSDSEEKRFFLKSVSERLCASACRDEDEGMMFGYYNHSFNNLSHNTSLVQELSAPTRHYKETNRIATRGTAFRFVFEQ